ncbi:MAG: phytase, partial [Leadbetterella sp.]|nr:phytase [Leadbetterella sp.]
MRRILCLLFSLIVWGGCTKTSQQENALKPVIITEPTEHDTDDPAIWLHPSDLSKSLIAGTDKEVGGGIYLYDLEGKIVNKVTGLQRPNNVDIAYGIEIGGRKTDIAVFTERKADKIRIFSLPDLKPVDNGGIEVFTGEEEKDPMGIALYTKGSEIYAIVGRKSGPSGSYLWQYKLSGNENGSITFRGSDRGRNYSLDYHLYTPRLSLLLLDLESLGSDGIYVEQTPDRVTVTYLGVTEADTANEITAQAELFFDGRVRL